MLEGFSPPSPRRRRQPDPSRSGSEGESGGGKTTRLGELAQRACEAVVLRYGLKILGKAKEHAIAREQRPKQAPPQLRLQGEADAANAELERDNGSWGGIQKWAL